jgi:hypothetical protein
MDAEIIMKNIFEVFDTNNTGKIVPNELLWIFSMSFKGKGKFRCVKTTFFPRNLCVSLEARVMLHKRHSLIVGDK